MAEFSKEINSTFPNERIKALLNIKFTANYFDTIGNIQLKPFNISEQQYNILRILRGAKEAITVKTVKDRMVQKSPNATRLMDKLCNKNLIERIACPEDRRVVHIEITKEGLILLDDISKNFKNDLLDKLTEAEAEQLSNLLDSLFKLLLLNVIA